jgi:hypothetical protein
MVKQRFVLLPLETLLAYLDENSSIGQIRLSEDLLHDRLLDRTGIHCWYTVCGERRER